MTVSSVIGRIPAIRSKPRSCRIGHGFKAEAADGGQRGQGPGISPEAGQGEAALYDGRIKTRGLTPNCRDFSIDRSWQKEELEIGKPLGLRGYLALRFIGNNVI